MKNRKRLYSCLQKSSLFHSLFFYKRRASELRKLLHRILVRHRRRLRRSAAFRLGDVVQGLRGWNFHSRQLWRQRSVLPRENGAGSDGLQGRPDRGNGGGDWNAEGGFEGQAGMADEIRRRRRRMATNSLREVLEVEIVKKVSSVCKVYKNTVYGYFSEY